MKDKAQASFYGLITGGFLSICQVAFVIINYKNPGDIFKINWDWYLFLMILILGCFTGNKFSIIGFNLRRRIENKDGKAAMEIPNGNREITEQDLSWFLE